MCRYRYTLHIHKSATVLTFGYSILQRKVFPSLGENYVRMVNGRHDGRSPSANREECIQSLENKGEK